MSEILVSEGIGEIIFLTSPYHSRKAKLLWEKNSSVDVKFNKSYEWPIKNNFFNYALNKKIIIYEYTSILYNKFLGRI